MSIISFQACDVITAYSYAFKFALQLQPSWTYEKKALRLSLLDSLSEQFFGGWYEEKERNQIIWEESSINIRVNDIHKAAYFLFASNRKMKLLIIQKSLVEVSNQFGANSSIGKKVGLIYKKLEHFTSKWQHEAIEYLRKQVNYDADLSFLTMSSNGFMTMSS